MAKGVWQSLRQHANASATLTSTLLDPRALTTTTSSPPTRHSPLIIHINDTIHLSVTSSYLYLGKHQNVQNTATIEVIARCNKTTTTFNTLSK
eukprot:1714945-Amphidinium_carterae.1